MKRQNSVEFFILFTKSTSAWKTVKVLAVYFLQVRKNFCGKKACQLDKVTENKKYRNFWGVNLIQHKDLILSWLKVL